MRVGEYHHALLPRIDPVVVVVVVVVVVGLPAVAEELAAAAVAAEGVAEEALGVGHQSTPTTQLGMEHRKMEGFLVKEK
jgi:hypothetical protein